MKWEEFVNKLTESLRKGEKKAWKVREGLYIEIAESKRKQGRLYVRLRFTDGVNTIIIPLFRYPTFSKLMETIDEKLDKRLIELVSRVRSAQFSSVESVEDISEEEEGE